jgi:antitoxin ChpS
VHTTNLRRVGGSVMLAVPPALLDILHLQPGATVGIAVEDGRLVVEPQRRRRYTLEALLAQCNPRARRARTEREWLDNSPQTANSSDETRRDLARQPGPHYGT